MSYRKLTLDERYQIQILRKRRISPAEIARELGRNRSTISRELHRNSDPRCVEPYLAERAARLCRQRRVKKGERSRKIRGNVQTIVEQKLRLSWSPEHISGRLRVELGVRLSHETIYQHVLRDNRQRGFLRYCLRFGGYKHHRLKKSKHAERTRQRKHWLYQRPEAANQRAEIGHWERDCIVGARGQSAMLTLIDRRSRYTRIRHVPRLNAKHVSDATVNLLRPHLDQAKTMTNDNGHEFQRDERLEQRLGIPIFFTDPSSPWQRGSIENLNGLVRQYLPKRTNFDSLPSWTAQALEETLNFRPRKVLGYRTPHEVFFGENVPLMSKPMLHFGLEFAVPT
jgi:IS30 family transposase